MSYLTYDPYKGVDVNDFTQRIADNPIENNRCAAPPFGCGKPVNALDFTDWLSAKEYQVSGLCQSCQDFVFRDPGDYSYEQYDGDAEEWEHNQMDFGGSD